MKIGVAQIQPVAGKIEENIRIHQTFVEAAIRLGGDLIVFSELSLTNYEPSMAANLAISPYDHRLDVFQEMSDHGKIRIGMGAPVKHEHGVSIGMILFRPQEERLTYFKRRLHPDEEAYFVGTKSDFVVLPFAERIALAICYELSIEEHLKNALDDDAQIYLASVAKHSGNIGDARSRLSEIAKCHSILTLMSNSIGMADGEECAGGSAIWKSDGSLLGQLNDLDQGILMVDTETTQLTTQILVPHKDSLPG